MQKIVGKKTKEGQRFCEASCVLCLNNSHDSSHTSHWSLQYIYMT